MSAIQSLLASPHHQTTSSKAPAAPATETASATAPRETIPQQQDAGDSVSFSAQSREMARASDTDALGATPQASAGTASGAGQAITGKIVSGAVAATGDWSAATTTNIATTTTASGRTVSVDRYSNAAGLTDANGASLSESGFRVTIGGAAGEEAQHYVLTGNTIINEDADGSLRIAAYQPGQETSGDDIIIGGLLDGTMRGGGGDDTIIGLADVGYVDVSGGDGDDTIIMANDANGRIDTGAGNDTVKAAVLGAGGAISIDTGSGDDTIEAAYIGLGGSVDITTGSGDDTVKASWIGINSKVAIDTGSGDDTVDASWIGVGFGDNASQVSIETGSGDDTVTSSWIGVGIGAEERGHTGPGPSVNVDTGSGDDTVAASWIGVGLSGTGSQVAIDTGSGDDTVAAGVVGFGNAQIALETGSGDDTVSVGVLGLGYHSFTLARPREQASASAKGGTTAGMVDLSDAYDTDDATKDLLHGLDGERRSDETGPQDRETAGARALTRRQGIKAYGLGGHLNV